MRIGQQIRDPWTISDAKITLALLDLFLGRLHEARRGFEEAAADYVAVGLPLMALYSLSWAGECCVMEGSLEGFKRIVAAFDGPKLARISKVHPVYLRILQGFDRLVEGDPRGAQSSFEEALRITGKVPTHSVWAFLNTPRVHFSYSAALRVMGREREATDHMERYLELLKAIHFTAALSSAAAREQLLVKGLRQMLERP